MNISHCNINHLHNPCGYAMESVTASWITESDVSSTQLAGRIRVAADPNMRRIVYDTGIRKDLDNRAAVLSFTPEPRTRYFWTVDVWGNAGDHGTSEVHWFETGKRGEPWQAQWITTPWADGALHPYFRGAFDLPGPIASARIYATGLGLYELELNGMRVSQERMTPGCNAYDAWLQVQTYDVTALLSPGPNAVGAWLGNGWAKGRFGNFPALERPCTDVFSLLLELRVQLSEGGQELVFGTGGDWRCAPSPILEDGIYDGEVYDARRALLGWSRPDFSDSRWEPVRLWQPERPWRLEDRRSPPVLVQTCIQPQALLHTPRGEWVLDFGQNIAGWVRFETDAPRDTCLTLSYGEILQDQCFYQGNLGTAKARHVYFSDGRRQTVEPHFTFFGFRYVKLEGFPEPIVPDRFVGCVVYSDLEETGWITTSDPLVNRLFANTKWSQKDNFLDVPTDCPQRDERMGWTGDAQVFCQTASFHMDTYAFFRKYLYDLWQEQQQMGGMVGCAVPTFFAAMPQESGFSSGGSAAWGDCATILPWTLYRQYGDAAILQAQYPSMQAWVEWIRRQCGESPLWNCGFHYGDWLALDGPVAGGTAGGTEIPYIASAYYCHSAELLSKAAAVLGKTADAQQYAALSQRIRTAIQQEYFSANGRCVLHTQTAYLLALQFHLIPPQQEARVAADLVAQLQKDGMHLRTGFVGTPFLCRVLAEHGYMDQAYTLFFQTDYPSWLYAVALGATTIWERWDSVQPDGSISNTDMNSLNHYAYGAIAQWLYSDVCGLKPETPGWKAFRIHPHPDARLPCVHCVYRSPMGRIESGWRMEQTGEITLRVRVPFHASAVLIVPNVAPDQIQGPVAAARHGARDACIRLTAGSYTFRYRPATPPRGTYSFGQTLRELNQSPVARAYLEQALPALYQLPPGREPNPEIPLRDALRAMHPRFLETLRRCADLTAVEQGLQALEIPIRDNGYRW